MSPKFGTSGLRGLVVDLTPACVGAHVRAFLRACPTGTGLFVGRDLRPSSPRIASDVIAAARAQGLAVTDCGALPTPALALAAMSAGAAAVMVTGSHIPADRNGLKFYLPTGEISKADEAAILAALAQDSADSAPAAGPLHGCPEAGAAYVARYVAAFGPTALAGLRLGLYAHSSVARDLLATLLKALGAEVVALARSDSFIPVDTEAVAPDTRRHLAEWCAEHRLDAVLSTDGDADRPLLTDAAGKVVPGDILGVLSAQALGAEVICTPVSSNSMVARIPAFRAVHRTKIGSPFVIAAMEAALARDPNAKVVGFEANGGFLQGFTAAGPAGPLPPLMTRDAVLPIVAPLAAARAAGRTLAEAVAALPPRHTAADRLTEIPTAASAALLAQLRDDATARAAFLAPLGREAGLDLTDGLRINLEDGTIVHLRPSGNAPEFRVYVEAQTAADAQNLLDRALDLVNRALSAH
ncbi:phosphohexomutase domain-containing protein [Phaeovulum vinaykumarii]|uniref:Phosphomannomutase n=1 Tax=Phaeovulum vinaykumarii TaxID=407234 RepID=A0A1N7N320_9RHOB|nr:phosphomannomutase [Phaeovulum vinaykumarii]SIS92678.1 phosphomannomutase [Phaeovulum vinaykumarii]SOC19152.1 phosphomannomutase [Phaeovulum vinaykumarii]